jgi:putative component of toxin-antitoxin plasmid stabilization module
LYSHDTTPFSDNLNPEAFENIRDTLTKVKVAARIDRLKQGNFGNCKSVEGEHLCQEVANIKTF